MKFNAAVLMVKVGLVNRFENCTDRTVFRRLFCTQNKFPFNEFERIRIKNRFVPVLRSVNNGM